MRCTGYEMARYKGTQASHLYEKSMHTLCTIQWATAPGRSLNYPRPKSITHLRTFSDNGVYVALQLFLVILVSDQWRRVLIPYSYRQAPWGLLHAQGWLSWYTWDQQLYVVSEPRETHSNVESQVFTPYKFGSTAGDRTPDLLTTRPTCYHSATALCNRPLAVFAAVLSTLGSIYAHDLSQFYGLKLISGDALLPK